MTGSYLDDLLRQILTDLLRPEILISTIVERKIEDYGIVLSDEQLSYLRQTLTTPPVENIRFELSPDQEALIGESMRSTQSLKIDVSDVELSDEQLQSVVQSVFDTFLDNISNEILGDWKTKHHSILELERKETAEFRKRIYEIWGEALDLTESLVSICEDNGALANQEFREVVENMQAVASKVEVVTRLHARGCQIATEIVSLLREGFADGAHARWRTLHETMTIAVFISEHDDQLAKRYLDHSIVSAFRQFKSYNEHYDAIGYAPPDPAEEARIKRDYEQIKLLYENENRFCSSDYGWAETVLPGANFFEIEKIVAKHMRPFYKLANINVHAGSDGIMFRLGAPPNDQSMLISGRSVFGLGEPIQNTAYSINRLTCTLLLLYPNTDRLVYCSATTKLMKEIVRTVDSIMQAMETESRL